MAALHVVLRSSHRTNSKPRPEGMDRTTCLRSLLRAVAEAGQPVELVHVVDGPVLDERGPLLRASGEVIEGSFTLAASYATAVGLATERGWPDDDVVYLVEDDHLHRPDALRLLLAAADAAPGAEILALYGAVDGRLPTGAEPAAPFATPPGWRPSGTSLVAAGHEWRRAVGTTSSTAARARVWRADRRLHDVGMRTRGQEGAHDLPICLALQGFRPYPWSRPFRHLVRGQEPLERRLKHGVWDVLLNGYSLRRHREILAASPSLATHAEVGWLAAGTDWEEVAAAARAWRPAGQATAS